MTKHGPTRLFDTHRNARYRANRSCAERDDNARSHGLNFVLQPAGASAHFLLMGPFVQPALSPRLPFEMLDRIGDKQLGPMDASLAQRIVQHTPGGANEHPASQVLFISG